MKAIRLEIIKIYNEDLNNAPVSESWVKVWYEDVCVCYSGPKNKLGHLKNFVLK